MNTIYLNSFFGFVCLCAATDLYEWGILSTSVNDTDDLRCKDSPIFDPFNAMRKMCNYEDVCSNIPKK